MELRRRMPVLLAGSGLIALLAADVRKVSATANDSKLFAYGSHLSGECSACHRVDGADNGIPSITG